MYPFRSSPLAQDFSAPAALREPCVGPAGEISLGMLWKHEEEQGDVWEMKAIRLYGQRGPDQIVFENAPQPQPGVGEALIRIHATSVMWQEPTWSETWKTPAGIERQHPIPGHDVSGEVVEVGPDVTRKRS